MSPPGNSRFSVYVVCTGNQCRSPLIAEILQRRTEGLGIDVASGGTAATVDVPPPRELIELGASSGLRLAEHVSKRLDAELIASADLVLTAERRHRDVAVVDGGARAERTFLLKELDRLLDEIEPIEEPDPLQRAQKLIALAHQKRLGSDFYPGENLDDPIGRSRAVYAASFAEISALTTRIADRLFGA